jgi:hypothetical protein
MPYKQKSVSPLKYTVAMLFATSSSTLIAQGLGQSVTAEHETRPNIVMIVTDDQHRVDFNFLPEGKDKDGKPRNLSPNIDKIASEGIIFNHM